MSDTFFGPVIEKLVGLLTEEDKIWKGVLQEVKSLKGALEIIQGLLYHGEAKSLKGVHQEVQGLKDELEIIQTLLKDADAKSEKGDTDDAVKVWLNQISALADRVEVVVDEYIIVI